jgi:hypothetical protein
MPASLPPPRKTAAMASFWRLIAYLVVAGVAMAIATVYYLSRYGPLTPMLVITAVGGVTVSIILGGGLMAVGFLSSNSGHDERAAAATRAVDPSAES